MNPAFVFLVLIGAVILWFLLSFLFKFIGGIIQYFYVKAKREMEIDKKPDIDSEEEKFIKNVR